MIRPAILLRIASLAVIIGGTLGAQPAGAAVFSGSDLADPPTTSACLATQPSVPVSCTFALESLPASSQAGGGTKAAISGVIVEWRIRTIVSEAFGPPEGSVRLRVVRGTTAIGAGPSEPSPQDAGIHVFKARVPVRAGDQIGLDVLGVKLSPPSMLRNVVGASFAVWQPPLGDGEERGVSTLAENYELMMNAKIEPDADGDGFGDETQDPCPGVPTATPPCAVTTAAAPAPDTTITKNKVDGDRVTFRFKSIPGGAGFECKLDKKPYKPCKSPKSYRNLSSGKHRFKVRAVSSDGVRDQSPAKRTFKVGS